MFSLGLTAGHEQSSLSREILGRQRYVCREYQVVYPRLGLVWPSCPRGAATLALPGSGVHTHHLLLCLCYSLLLSPRWRTSLVGICLRDSCYSHHDRDTVPSLLASHCVIVAHSPITKEPNWRWSHPRACVPPGFPGLGLCARVPILFSLGVLVPWL